MANTTKVMTDKDSGQTLQAAYNEVNATLGVDGFVTGKVGRKIVRTAVSGTVDDFEFFEGSNLLYTIRITYSNATHDDINQVERTV